ncbi:alpha/beta hydrolase [Paraburkholderia sp.]|uniref:serine aminopeptidase domain-containing protein n=1 Tax=Paraburkholderia sp. TaxID=1926495 RepID=UPI0023A1D7E4|nr:alpha/beta hydrolase [Paraburkholderia sp.]MDE1184400.1 alpha/beta hydrolase [Paraburkholderia sp.]
MTPVVFNDCFGWLHPARGNTGVVLCQPFGYDALCTARGMRHLAERLAEDGMPTLRFDYPGTGDSAGDAQEAARFRAWIDSVKHAVAYLKDTTGVERVALCGLRLGATLAALAAQELDGVDDLVLMAPVLSGKNYIRELRAHYRTWRSIPAGKDSEPVPDTNEFVEAFGFRMYRDSMEPLIAVDLKRDASRPARRVLILDSLDPTRIASLADHYSAQRIAVERLHFDEFGKFMLESLDSELPRNAIASITTWLGLENRVCASGETGDAAASVADANAQDEAVALNAARIADDGAIETPVWIDGERRLFGIYCEPTGASGTANTAPTVLFLNTGAVSHIGNARLTVRFARRLARQGISSLRVDLGSLGESQPLVDRLNLDSINADTQWQDAIRAARWLNEQGRGETVLFGVCAGAFAGLKAAAAEPAVRGAVLVNLQRFVWTNVCDDNGKPPVDLVKFGTTRDYLRSALQPAKWMRFLKGQTGGLGIARALAVRFSARFKAAGADWLERTFHIGLGNPVVREMFRSLDTRGVKLRLLFGSNDLGVEELEHYFGLRGRRLRRYAQIRADFHDKMDHALLSSHAQDRVMDYFETYLRESFLVARHAEPSSATRFAKPVGEDGQTGIDTPQPVA